MSVILLQDGFESDSSGWRPRGPKDHWSVTVQVVKRHIASSEGKYVGRKPEINLDILHVADDTPNKEWTNTPLTADAARKLASILIEAAQVAERGEHAAAAVKETQHG